MNGLLKGIDWNFYFRLVFYINIVSKIRVFDKSFIFYLFEFLYKLC